MELGWYGIDLLHLGESDQNIGAGPATLSELSVLLLFVLLSTDVSLVGNSTPDLESVSGPEVVPSPVVSVVMVVVLVPANRRMTSSTEIHLRFV